MLSRLNNMTFSTGLHEVCVRKDRRAGVRCVITKFSCSHKFPIHLSNGAPPRKCARKFRCNSEVQLYLITLFYYKKTSVSLFIVPSACWAWRRQLEKEQEV